MCLNGEWDKHEAFSKSLSDTMQSMFRGSLFFYLHLPFGVKWSYAPCLEVSIGFIPPAHTVYDLFHPYWQPWWLKQVLQSIENQLDLVKQNQCTQNEQTRPSNVFIRGSNWELHGTSWDDTVSEKKPFRVDFVNHHRNEFTWKFPPTK